MTDEELDDYYEGIPEADEWEPEIIEIEVRPQKGPQEMFLSSRADIVIYGGTAGCGKSFALLMEAARNIENPRYRGALFRRTYPMITNPGGLWDESHEIYEGLGGVPYESNPKRWEFEGGARISLHHLQRESDVYGWHGAQLDFAGFDELTHFTEKQFFYMLSRMRSTSGIRPYVRATCNADAESWVAKLIDWWIDPDTGFPIAERSGVVRYFIRVNNSLVWADSYEELVEAHPEEEEAIKSLTFIAGYLDDNQKLLEKDPHYRGNLMIQQFVDRERLLKNNWKIRYTTGNFFREGWLPIKKIARIPTSARFVRYWDKAGTEDGGDWSAGVLVAELNGYFYIVDVVRGQWSPEERNKQIRATALSDRKKYGVDVDIWFEQEPGSSGLESAIISIRELQGYNVYYEPVTGDKRTRAKPLSAQAERGFVVVCEGPWNDAFIQEMIAFPTKGIHDDQVDAASGAFAKLAVYEQATVEVR